MSLVAIPLFLPYYLFPLHLDRLEAANSPMIKVQWVNCDPEPMFVFSGGFPDGTSIGVKSLTFYNSKNTKLLNFESSIVDFICLQSTPFITGKLDYALYNYQLFKFVCVNS